ncbi:DNA-binding transcriptional regulator RstA [Escherichia coli]|nr:DNA-binding transcriptional regulator RstA [Escherichia coli]CTU72524.1 DNA-binding transcriptional regulator RstA [Escherichia coli]CTU74792.1 DNA-binding transcriptional regulator RstA [Escherichia coli]
MNTIVFVEDDAEVGSLIAAYLAKHDMQVTVEPRGDQAEETIFIVGISYPCRANHGPRCIAEKFTRRQL